MDVVICVNHGKMNGTNIVVNATIFNDSLNEFRFRIDNGEWIYTKKVEGANKTYDVIFSELLHGEPHRIVCQYLKDGVWAYGGYIVTACNTCICETTATRDIQQREYYEPKCNKLKLDCVVM